MKTYNVDVLIQARTGSARLPGKVTLPLGTSTVLGFMLDRVKRARLIRQVVVLTTVSERDDAVVEIAERHNVKWFRGSEEDVLDRYYRGALACGTDIIVRLTGDCPFMDPMLLDDMVGLYSFNLPRIEFLTNCFQRTFARGLDIEIFSMDLLKRLNDMCRETYYREHVIPYVEEHTDEFAFIEYPNRRDDSRYRLTVDTEEDYRTVTAVYGLLKRDDFTYDDLIDAVSKNEHVIVNDAVRHKAYTE